MSAHGFLWRFLLGLCAALCAAVFAAGCAMAERNGAVLGAGQAQGTWATTAELSWLERLGAWDARLIQGLREAARIERSPLLARRLAASHSATVERHENALAVTGSCLADLLRQVGSAPSDRLRAVHVTFSRACVHLQRFRSAMRNALRVGGQNQIRRAQLEARKGSALLLEADQMIPPGEVRALPVIGGESAESRIEPRFGRLASALAGKAIQVRCWSSGDWHRLMREEAAYTRGQLGPDTLGFAGISGNRVSLAPEVCDSLVGLAYEGQRPEGEGEQLLLAAALVTLSHEPQHSRGISDEAVAECNAIQVAHVTAAELGATPQYAAALVRTYWRHYDDELAPYRSPDCRDGGALDRGYAGSIWR